MIENYSIFFLKRILIFIDRIFNRLLKQCGDFMDITKTPVPFFENEYIHTSVIAYILIAFFVIIVIFSSLGKKYFKKLRFTDLSVSFIMYITTLVPYFFRDAFNDNKRINSFANFVINFEWIVITLLVVFLVIQILYKNRRVVISKYKKYLCPIQLIYMYAFILSGEISKNIVSFIIGELFFGILFVLLYSSPIVETDVKPKEKVNSPIDSFTELFESRQTQCEEFNTLLKEYKDNGDCSICVSGDWGIGKTSFINSFQDRYKKDYHFIRINAMGMDKLEVLIDYFLKSLEKILKSNRIYTGVNSTYKELAKSLADIVSGKKISNVFPESKDTYRESLKKVNDIINKNIDNKLILIVIDDLERCTEDIIRQYLFFIKEISYIDKCVPIYLCDYNQLMELKIEDKYLEKFFDHKFILNDISLEELLKTLKDYNLSDINLDGFIDCYNRVINDLEYDISNSKGKSCEESKQKIKSEKIVNAEITQSTRDVFISEINNPRRLIKIAKRYSQWMNIIHNQYSQNDTAYIECLNLVDYKFNVFLLSVIYILNRNLYVRIKNSGLFAYLHSISDSKDKSPITKDNFRFIIVEEIVSRYWYKTSIFSHDLDPDYLYHKKIRFIDVLLREPNDLVKSLNEYTTEEDEIFGKIINRDRSVCKKDIYNVISIIINANTDCPKKQNSLLENYFSLLQETNVPLSNICDIFKNDTFPVIFSMGYKISELFYNSFCKDNLNREILSDENYISLNKKKEYYFYKLKIFERFLSLIVPVKGAKNLIEYSEKINPNEDIESIIKLVVEENLGKGPNSYSKLDSNNDFTNLNKKINDRVCNLSNSNLLISVVEQERQETCDAINEMRYFDKICVYFEKDVNKETSSKKNESVQTKINKIINMAESGESFQNILEASKDILEYITDNDLQSNNEIKGLVSTMIYKVYNRHKEIGVYLLRRCMDIRDNINILD